METRQPDVWAAALITYFAALIAFFLRLLARRLKGVPFHWGDLVATIAFLFTTGYLALSIYRIRVGLGLHLKDLGLGSDNDAFDTVAVVYFRLLYVDMWLYTGAMGLSKLTALALFWRIFGQSTIKIPILILSACVVLWMIARIFVISLLCVPIQKFWFSDRPGHCGVSTNIFFFGSTIPHLIIEIAIVIMPCMKIRQLNLPRVQKFAVAGMFASGTLVIVASIYQLVEAIRLDTSSLDLWWTSTPQLTAAIIEINLGHFSTSLPNLRPILDIITGRKSLSETRETPTYGQYGHSTHRSTYRRRPQELFSHRRDSHTTNDSEVELAQYEGGAMPGEIWKSTTMKVQTSKRDSF